MPDCEVRMLGTRQESLLEKGGYNDCHRDAQIQPKPDHPDLIIS